MANTSKYLSYKYAFDRMKTAVRRGFHLEAVVIAESLISDRLHSASGTAGDPINRKTGQPSHVGLAELIKRASQNGMASDMVADLDAWRNDRNRVAHAVARSRPGEPTMPVGEYRALSKRTAEKGIELANRVKRWQRSAKVRAPRPSASRCRTRSRHFMRPEHQG